MALNCFFPVKTVEPRWVDLVEIHPVEAAHIDVDFVRVGARDVKGMDSAVAAEVMLGHAGVELVRRKVFRAAHELELVTRNDQVKEALLRADRAVALAHPLEARGHAETDAPAVATALVRLHAIPVECSVEAEIATNGSDL